MTPTPQQTLSDLAQVFAHQTVTTARLDLYLRELADVPPEALERAVRTLIRTSEFFPTIRAIREQVAEQTLALPDEAGALAEVDALAAWARIAEEDRGAPPALNPVVRAAFVAAGGSSAFRDTNASVVRGQFARLYRDLRARAVRDAQISGIRQIAER